MVLFLAAAPQITVQIFDDGVTPTLGLQYIFTCSVSVDESLNATTTYQWIKNNGTQTQIGTNSNTLSFSNLKLSDAGQYACIVTLNNTLTQSAYKQITLTGKAITIVLYQMLPTLPSVPAPVISVVSDPVSPIHPIGSDVILTCTVELSPTVDISVVVNIQMTDSTGYLLTTTTPSVSGSMYISTASVGSFGRAQSGLYTCTVTVSPISSFFSTISQSATVIVSIGKNLNYI